MTKDKLMIEMREFVLSCLRERLELLGMDPGEINDDISLTGSGLIDSMGFVELVGSFEDKFDYEIDLDEYDPEEFTTLGGFLRCAIHSKVSA